MGGGIGEELIGGGVTELWTAVGNYGMGGGGRWWFARDRLFRERFDQVGGWLRLNKEHSVRVAREQVRRLRRSEAGVGGWVGLLIREQVARVAAKQAERTRDRWESSFENNDDRGSR